MNNEFIFLIEKIWMDSSENYDSYGYKPWSYTYNEQEAIDFCKSHEQLTQKDHYAFCVPMDKYRYTKIEVLSGLINDQ
jgi:L,D-peptidoglycan transpeptidase YkuD (ErfK/YbiS/YcfS/YnhG family)